MITSKKYLKEISRNEGVDLLAIGQRLLEDARQRNMTKEVFNEVRFSFIEKLKLSKDSLNSEEIESTTNLMIRLKFDFSSWDIPEPSRYQMPSTLPNEDYL